MAKSRKQYATPQEVENFKRNIARLIHLYGGSQSQLAVECGIVKDTLSRWRDEGLTGRNLSSVKKLANFFNVDVRSMWEEELVFLPVSSDRDSPVQTKFDEIMATPARLVLEGVIDALHRSWVMRA